MRFTHDQALDCFPCVVTRGGTIKRFAVKFENFKRTHLIRRVRMIKLSYLIFLAKALKGQKSNLFDRP